MSARRSCSTLAVSVFALVISLGSLTFSIYQDARVSEYRRLAIEPILAVDRILAPVEGYGGIGLYISNVGNGVANIVALKITYPGLEVDSPNDILAAIADLAVRESDELETVVAVGPRFGSKVQAGERVMLIGIPSIDATRERAEALGEYVFRIGLEIEYQSLDEKAPTKRVQISAAPDETQQP